MESKEVIIFVSGDFCPVGRIEDKILSNTANDIFGDLLPVIMDADISITNLESPLTTRNKPILKTGPALKGISETANLLKNAGFDLVTLANNHIMDYGERGLKDTLEELDINNIKYVGAGNNGNEARKIYYLKKNGLNIAIINIAENEWSTTDDEKAGANPINPIANYYFIKEAKENADKVIVITHGGHELYDLPSPKMKELFRFFVDVGADIVINHHTHHISGYEIYKNAPIFYSLGNFIFDNPSYKHSKWNSGISLLLHIDKSRLKFKILSFEQCNEYARISLHNENERSMIDHKIKGLNRIISSDKALKISFEKHVKSKSRLYTSYIEPIKNKYILALQNRKLAPRLITKKSKLLLKNIIKCESHREVLIKILENENSNS